jgi:molybdopterin-containing oxidoreductase family molybdopterin binding subunit
MAAIKYIEETGLAADDYLNTLTVAPFLVKQTDGTFLRQSDLNGGEGAGTPEDAVLVWDSAADAAGSFMEVAAPALRGSFTAGDFEVSTAYQLLIERVADYSVDKAARLCDLSEEQVVAFAEACADNSAITAGMGPDHWGNGLGTFMAFLALKLQTGGLKQLEGYSSPTVYWPLTGFGLDEEGHPTEAPLELSPWMALPLAKEGKVELPGTTFERPLKALAFCMGGRATGWADHNRVIELFKTVDFFFAADINWGDNVQYADIVLPAASQFEVDDMENTMNYLVFCEKAIEPIYDSKPDFEIACLLAEGMGFGEDFKVKTIDDTLDITIRGNSSLSAMGLTIPDLRAAKYIEFTEPSTPPSFYTAFGRAVFYLENPRPGKDYGQTIDVERVRLPYFHAPTEAWTVSVDEFERNPLADQYPLTYLTGPRRFRTHGAFNMAANLRELDQEPSVYVNPQDAAERGIADGDTVKLFNDRGFVVARCVYHNGMRPGVVDMDRGWQTGQYKDNAGHFNSLTHVVMDPACYNHALYDVLCQMEKA